MPGIKPFNFSNFLLTQYERDLFKATKESLIFAEKNNPSTLSGIELLSTETKGDCGPQAFIASLIANQTFEQSDYVPQSHQDVRNLIADTLKSLIDKNIVSDVDMGNGLKLETMLLSTQLIGQGPTKTCQNINEYQELMAKSGTYFGEIEWVLLSRVLKICIVVIGWDSSKNNHFRVVYGLEVNPHAIALYRKGMHYEGIKTSQTVMAGLLDADNEKVEKTLASFSPAKPALPDYPCPKNTEDLNLGEGDPRPGYIGTDYQVLWTVHCLFKALNEGKTVVQVATEEDGFGKFDDIVLHDGNGDVTAIQVKCNTSQSPKSYSANDFLTTYKGGGKKVSLGKYFDSWWKVRNAAGKKAAQYRFQLLSNYQAPKGKGDNDRFSECVDWDTGKFKSEFITENLHSDLLYRLREDIYNQSKSLENFLLKQSQKNTISECLGEVTHYIGPPDIPSDFHENALNLFAAQIDTILDKNKSQNTWSLAKNGAGINRYHAKDWREKLSPALLTDDSDICRFNDHFFNADETSEMGKLHKKLIDVIGNKEANPAGFLRNLTINTSKPHIKKIRSQTKTFIDVTDLDLRQESHNWIAAYLSSIELRLGEQNYTELEAAIKQQIFSSAKSVETPVFYNFMHQVREWFRKATKNDPLTKDKKDEFLRKGSPGYQQMYLVAHTATHKQSQQHLDPYLFPNSLFSNIFSTLSTFQSSKETALCLQAPSKGLPGAMMHRYFAQSGDLQGAFFILNAARYLADNNHALSLRTPQFKVLVLDNADILSEDTVNKIITDVESTKKKVIFICQIQPEWMKENKTITVKTYNPKIQPTLLMLNASVTYQGNQRSLSSLPKPLQQQLSENTLQLCRLLSNHNLTLPKYSQSVSTEEFPNDYEPIAAKQRVFWYDFDVLKNPRTRYLSHSAEDKESLVNALKNKGFQLKKNSPNDPTNSECYLFATAAKKYELYLIRKEEIGSEYFVAEIIGGQYLCRPSDYSVIDAPVIKTQTLILDSARDEVQAMLLEQSTPLLIEGLAGLGKSRLAYEIANNPNLWSILLQAQDLVNQSPDIPLASWVCGCLGLDPDDTTITLIEDGIRDENILLIFDGLDELTTQQQAYHATLLKQIMNYPKLLVLGRPEGFRPDQRFQEIELRPFNKKQLNNYIKRRLQNPERVSKEIQNTDVFNTIKIPLYAKMFCDLFSDNSLPDKITNATLHQSYELRMLKEYLRQEGMNPKLLADQNRVKRRTHDEISTLRCLAMVKTGWLREKWRLTEERLLSQYTEDTSLWTDIKEKLRILVFPSTHTKGDLAQIRFSHMSFSEYFTASRIIQGLTENPGTDLYQQAKAAINCHWHTPAYKKIWSFVMALTSKDTRAHLTNLVKSIDVWHQRETDETDQSDMKNHESPSSGGSKADSKLLPASDFSSLISALKAPETYYYNDRKEHDEAFSETSKKLSKMPLNFCQVEELAVFLKENFDKKATRKDKTAWTILETIGDLSFAHRLLANKIIDSDFIDLQLKILKDSTEEKWRDSHGYNDASRALTQNLQSTEEILNENVSSFPWWLQCHYINQILLLANHTQDKQQQRKIRSQLLTIAANGDITPKTNALEALFEIARLDWDDFSMDQWRDDVLNRFQPGQDHSKLDDLIDTLLRLLEEAKLLNEPKTVGLLSNILSYMFDNANNVKYTYYATKAWEALTDLGDDLPLSYLPLIKTEIKKDNKKLLKAANLGPQFFIGQKKEIEMALTHAINATNKAYKIRGYLTTWQLHTNQQEIDQALTSIIKTSSTKKLESIGQAYAKLVSGPNAIALLINSTEIADTRTPQAHIAKAVAILVKKLGVTVVAFEGGLTLSDRRSVIDLSELNVEFAASLRKAILPDSSAPTPSSRAGLFSSTPNSPRRPPSQPTADQPGCK